MRKNEAMCESSAWTSVLSRVWKPSRPPQNTVSSIVTHQPLNSTAVCTEPLKYATSVPYPLIHSLQHQWIILSIATVIGINNNSNSNNDNNTNSNKKILQLTMHCHLSASVQLLIFDLIVQSVFTRLLLLCTAILFTCTLNKKFKQTELDGLPSTVISPPAVTLTFDLLTRKPKQ